MTELYPEIEPYEHGLLPVGDGHEIHWEVCGNPDGKPAVFLHGGPGGGSAPAHRRLFDPERYRIVLLDQRGCGRSRPHCAHDADAGLAANTTWHLVADLERLREHLGIERWLVFGGSWGSTLALAYAETHPGRVSELVLRGIWTMRRKELDWFYGGAAGCLFPERWERFLEPVPPRRRDGDLIAAYHDLLFDPDPAVHRPAAVAWSTWEADTITVRRRPELVEQFSDPEYALAFARIENHYCAHGGWFTGDQLLRDAGRLAGIPAVLIHGRHDVCTPPVGAWEVHRALPGSELIMVEDAGHAFDEPGILRELLRATDTFAST
ncbi:prolyl aminopeptidase [Prauserella muralis]|uniref:Proline iminopeptidase n=1 Tax=Prauserella muralis TaxID=588067 RepID=A0A2V4B259_9PSEU|nr:prolyl aminopeptidase [Prauserella muralis]PXY28351.1 prolyl aminopeptidase [Prauserella muralis]TWE23040.1 prolyl aminopeptidase [Prauserella muralis]